MVTAPVPTPIPAAPKTPKEILADALSVVHEGEDTLHGLAVTQLQNLEVHARNALVRQFAAHIDPALHSVQGLSQRLVNYARSTGMLSQLGQALLIKLGVQAPAVAGATPAPQGDTIPPSNPAAPAAQGDTIPS